MTKARNIADLGSNDVIETTATGVDVTGTVTADGLVVDNSTSSTVALFNYTGGTDAYLGLDGTGTPIYMGNKNGEVVFQTSGSGYADKLKIATNGDVSFYEDTGTTAKMVWSSSAESLGIGLPNPQDKLHVAGGKIKVTGSGNVASYGYIKGTEATFNTHTLTLGTTYGYATDVDALSIFNGNVGIGTASPSAKLDSHDNSASIRATRASNTDQYIELAGGDGSGLSHINANYQMAFKTGNTERARIDSSGNLLVGTSTSPVGSGGLSVNNRFTVGYQGALNGYGAENYSGLFYSGGNNAGYTAINSNSANGCLYLSRTASAPTGLMLHFASNGSTVGSIGANGGRPYLASTTVGIRVSNALFPCNTSGVIWDNAIDIGGSSGRWNDIYATNGTIQTSDRNEKQDIETLSDAEQRVAKACKGLLRKFRWKDSVAEKGDDARIHFGIIAQDLQDAFTAEGLDAGRYAMFISTTWTDEETGEERTRLGVRYPELLAFIISAL